MVDVQDGSPADDAGLERGDRIVAVDGDPVVTATDLVAKIRGAKPGDVVTLSIDRDGDAQEITVTLGKR